MNRSSSYLIAAQSQCEHCIDWACLLQLQVAGTHHSPMLSALLEHWTQPPWLQAKGSVFAGALLPHSRWVWPVAKQWQRLPSGHQEGKASPMTSCFVLHGHAVAATVFLVLFSYTACAAPRHRLLFL